MRTDGTREGLRQAMAWLHTWVGLVLGWLLFAIFLSGTLAFFRQELNLWGRPELHGLATGRAETRLDASELARAERTLQALAPSAQGWRLTLPDERRAGANLSWREPAAAPGQRARLEQRWLDPQGGAPIEARDSFGAGEFFYRFHFELRSAQQSRWIQEGRWLVGLATLLMFVALLSGIVTHRRFFKDFFTFRPRAKAAQRAWLDAHNVSGVLVLPFYLLITFSGLMILHAQYLPAGIAAAYGKESGAYFAELTGDPARAARARESASSKDLKDATGALPMIGEAGWTALLAQARAQWPQGRIEAVALQREGGHTRVEIFRHEGDRLQYRAPRLVFDAATGRRLHLVDTEAPAARTYGVLHGLHMARFAGWPLRWTLFGFGLLGSAMIATGLVLWCVKRRAEAERRQAKPGFGYRLVGVLNVATIAGLPLAMAAFLHATRLLPLALAQRPDAELKVFFAAWGLALLAAALGAGWRSLFAAAALAFAALPASDAVQGLPLSGSGMLLGVQLAFGGAALLLAFLAWRCGSPLRRQVTARPAPVPPVAGQLEGAP